MSVRVIKRCTKCTSTFASAHCPKGCPRKHVRWVVIEDTRKDGKRTRRTVGTYDTQHEAEAVRVESEDNDRRGHAVVASSVTLEEWCHEWVETQGHRFSATTMGTFASGIKRWLIPALGDRRLRDLSPTDFDRLYRDMTRKLKPVTIRSYSRGWHSLLNDAVKRRMLVRNPMDGANTPKVEKVTPRLLTPDEVGEVLTLMGKERHGLVFRLLVITGARRGEVLGLCWDDLDLDAEQPVAKIRRTLNSTMSGLRIGPPKTESSKRTVALDPLTADLLRELRREDRTEAMRVGREAWMSAATVLDRNDDPQALDLVLRRDDGRPLEPSRVTAWWRAFLVRNGYDHVKLHSLRHAWATVAIENGVPMKTVQVQLGHSNYSTTADLYSHVTEKAQADATAKVMEQYGA